MLYTPAVLRPLAIFITTITLVGCKLAVIVPEGGYVTWNSTDSGTCRAEDTCVVDVSDFDFARDHTAVPDPGWEFLGWRKGQGYLCGGSIDGCDLSLQAIEEFEDSKDSNKRLLYRVIATLLSDREEAFFLEPVFGEIGDTSQFSTSYRLLDNAPESPEPWIHSLREDIVETNDGFYFTFEDKDQSIEGASDKEYVAKVVHQPTVRKCADWCWVEDYGTHFIRHLSPNVLADEGFTFEISYVDTQSGDHVFNQWGMSQVPLAVDHLVGTANSFTAVATSFDGATEIAVTIYNEVLYNHDGEWRLLENRLGFTGSLPDIHGHTRLVAVKDAVWIITYKLSGEEDRAYRVTSLESQEYSMGKEIHQMVADSNDKGIWALMGEGLYFFPYEVAEGGKKRWSVVVEDLTKDVEIAPSADLHHMAQDTHNVYVNYFKAVRKGTGKICRFMNRNLDQENAEQIRVMKDLFYRGPVSVSDRRGDVYFVYHDSSEAKSLDEVVDYIAVTTTSFIAGCPKWTSRELELYIVN